LADEAEMADEAETDDATAADAVIRPSSNASPRWRARRPTIAALAALVALTGFLGWRDVQVRRGEQLRESMVQAGRDGVLALTTIDHERVDADVQRILDTSTGTFREDFAQRAESFKDAARKAASKSVGTVVESGFESLDGDLGKVLVAAVVMTSNRGAPEQQAKGWRTRVSVIRDGDVFKVAAVEFIP
jgi:Mce-associated membrane protein